MGVMQYFFQEKTVPPTMFLMTGELAELVIL
jgi:hypothetical protein